MSGVYRLLPANGGVMYVQTEASLIFESAFASAVPPTSPGPISTQSKSPTAASATGASGVPTGTIISYSNSNGKSRPLGTFYFLTFSLLQLVHD